MSSKNKSVSDETVLSASKLLALRVADQALRVLLSAQEVGWSHMKITGKHIQSFRDTTTYLYTLEGKFYGQGTPHFYTGRVSVQLIQQGEGGRWYSNIVEITPNHGQSNCFIKPLTTYMCETPESICRRFTITTADGFLPRLTSEYRPAA